MCKHTPATITPSVLAVVFLLVLTASLASAGPNSLQEENHWMDLGRRCTDLFFSAAMDELYGLFDETMKGAMNEDQLQQFLNQVVTQLGDEKERLEEKTSAADEYQVYERISTYANSGDTQIVVRWAFDSNSQVSGFFIQPVQ